MVSKLTPSILPLLHPRNMNEICPAKKQSPTRTFQNRSGLGAGLNLPITIPEIRKPRTIPIKVSGPARNYKILSILWLT